MGLQRALLEQLRGGPRPEELTAARATYEVALAKYAELRAGATDAESKAAEQGVAAAQADLARAQSALVLIKAPVEPQAIRLAEQEIERQKSALWAAQVERDGVKGNKANPEFMGVAADARVMAAEVAVQEAQNKLSQVQTAAPRPEEISAAERTVVSAEASLRSAEAKLNQLQSGGRPGELASAHGAVVIAEAQLDLKQSGPSTEDIAVGQARLRQAETQLAQAKQGLANAELRAPFPGTVIALVSRAGEYVTPAAPVISLADLSALRVDTSDLDEYSVKSAFPGKSVRVTINALTNKQVSGVIRSIAPTGTTNTNGDTTFTAVIDLADQDQALRPGMTVKVTLGGN